MARDDSEASRIVQALLDKSSASMVAGDYDTFASCYGLPMLIDTFDGQVRIETEAQLRNRYDQLRAHYDRNSMTDLVRNVVSASWFDDVTIHATHQGRILSGTQLMQAPYTVFTIFKKSGDSWNAIFGQYAIADSSAHNAALLGESPPETGETHD